MFRFLLLERLDVARLEKAKIARDHEPPVQKTRRATRLKTPIGRPEIA